MEPLFQHDILNLSALQPDLRVIQVLQEGCDRAITVVRPGDLLAAALESGDSRISEIFSTCLVKGCSIQHIIKALEAYRPRRKTESDFDGSPSRFAKETLKSLEEFENRMNAANSKAAEFGLELLVASVLAHLDEDDRSNLKYLDAERGAKLFGNIEPTHKKEAFDQVTGALSKTLFTEKARGTLENAGKLAGQLGYDLILPPHIFLALLSETQGVAERILRRRLRPDLSIGRLTQYIHDDLRRAQRNSTTLPPTQKSFGEEALQLLDESQAQARRAGREIVDPFYLLAAILTHPPAKLVGLLESTTVDLKVDQLLADIRAEVNKEPEEPQFVLPTGILPSEDLTWVGRTGSLQRAGHMDATIEGIVRGLFRRLMPHVLLTGLRGVGKTKAIRELARRAANGEVSFLEQKRFLWVDCRDVPNESSREKLEAVFSYAVGRTDLVLCLDGLDNLLRGPSGSSHKVRFRGVLKIPNLQIVGIMSDIAFQDIFAADHELMECCTHVTMPEPDIRIAKDITRDAAVELAQVFKTRFEPRAVERAVTVAEDYILNERLPSKAIKLLYRACEDLEYERAQGGSPREEVTTSDVIRVASKITGIPESTLAGVGDKMDYAKSLSEWVVGQPEAVQAAAAELQMIKAGLSHAGKPASVMFFAGLTGCGKTELAKVLARFYSTSKRLQTITMGNFTEAHSVSGIIGVPPGYVGHEQGGRLINDLNADPYCVFLLDEAEKAHPDVWKPFLNLFDEGWVVDQRGVKAFAEQAIIILTSNAGHEIIAAESRRGTPTEDIIAAVKKHLTELRHQSSGQAVFSPEFLARIGRIIVFRPLDRPAMEGICRKMIDEFCRFWKDRREQTLVVPETLKREIAQLGFEENERSGGKEGGRILAKLIRTKIEEVMRREWEEQDSTARRHNTATLAPVKGKLCVTFHTEPPRLPTASLEQASQILRSAMQQTPGKLGFDELVKQVMTDLLADMENAKTVVEGETETEAAGKVQHLVEELKILIAATQASRNASERESWARLEQTLHRLEGGPTRGATA